MPRHVVQSPSTAPRPQLLATAVSKNIRKNTEKAIHKTIEQARQFTDLLKTSSTQCSSSGAQGIEIPADAVLVTPATSGASKVPKRGGRPKLAITPTTLERREEAHRQKRTAYIKHYRAQLRDGEFCHSHSYFSFTVLQLSVWQNQTPRHLRHGRLPTIAMTVAGARRMPHCCTHLQCRVRHDNCSSTVLCRNQVCCVCQRVVQAAQVLLTKLTMMGGRRQH